MPLAKVNSVTSEHCRGDNPTMERARSAPPEPSFRRAGYTLAYGLAGILAHDPLGRGSERHSGCDRVPACLLDCVLTLAVEISGRSPCCPANCAATHCFGLLCFGCAWAAQPARPMVADDHRPHTRVHL